MLKLFILNTRSEPSCAIVDWPLLLLPPRIWRCRKCIRTSCKIVPRNPRIQALLGSVFVQCHVVWTSPGSLQIPRKEFSQFGTRIERSIHENQGSSAVCMRWSFWCQMHFGELFRVWPRHSNKSWVHWIQTWEFPGSKEILWKCSSFRRIRASPLV